MSSLYSTMDDAVFGFRSSVSRAVYAHDDVLGLLGRIASGIAILIVVNYIVALLRYHRAHASDRDAKCQLPPQYPFLIPYLGPFFQLWWDHGGFIRRMSSYAGRLTSNRISFLGHTLYSFQDRETIERLFKQSSLSSSIDMYGFVNSNLLGTNQKTMEIYRADDSGPFLQPHPKSNVPQHNRIDHITHNSVFRGLTGPGLQPTMNRFTADFIRRLQDLDITDEWTEMPDFAQFFKDVVGLATLHSILGPTMFRLNPTFSTDIFAYDKLFPTFAPGFPRFMMPKAHQLRDNLVGQFLKWYEYARKNFDSSMIEADGDGDPVWGSAMMRLRQDAILKVDKCDDEALARVDLGLAWATIGNVVPSSMFAAFHLFNDKDVLARVRHDIQHYVGQGSIRDVEPHHFSKDMALLSSLYAETLRLYIKVYSVYSSPHSDVDLGKWVLPKGALAVLNSEPSHMDSTFWNTQGGKHPVDSFWADRFLVNPSDPESGPINPACRKSTTRAENDTAKDLYFSTEGCEGAWIPYGGGHSMCPGRFMARNVIIYSNALLASEYDIELSSDPIEFTKKRYGFGVEDMKNPIPFRIRKRKVRN